MTESIEYRVRPVTRYIVTRHYQMTHDNGMASGGCEERGEFSNPSIAYDVAHSLAFKEREDLGWPPGDERILFPEMPARPRNEGV